MSNLRTRSATLTLLLISILILAACGGGTAPAAAPTTEAPTEAAAATEAPTEAAAATEAPAEPAGAGEATGEVRVAFYNISDQYNSVLENMIKSFEQANPNVQAKLEIRPIDGYWDKLQTEFAAGTAPDITINQTNWVIPGAVRGMFVDLKPYMTKDNVDLDAYYFPHDKDWGWRGGIYGGFSAAAGQALYINKDLLKAAGLEFPKEDWTWNDMLEYAKKLTDPAKNQWGIHIGGVDPPYWGTSFIHAAGGTVLNEAQDKCTLTDPKAQEGLQFLADLIHKEKVMPAPASLEGQENPFITGKVGMYFGGTWSGGQVREAGFDWDYAHMPAHPTTGKRSVQVGTNSWSILGSSKNKDGAWEVVKYLMGEGGSKGLMSLSVPALTSVAQSQEYLALHQPQQIQVVLDDFANYGHDYYTTPDTDEWYAAVAQELSVLWSGEATVAEATERACQAIDEIFARRPAEYQE